MPIFGVHPPDLLQAVAEDIGVAMLVVDREEKVVFANHMAVEMFDVTTSAEGARFRDVRRKIRLDDSSGNEIPVARALVMRALKNEPVESQEVRFKKRNGESKWLIARVYRFASMGFEGVALFVTDETAEVEIRKENALLQRMETIATLAAGLTHDFNNVLNTITTNVALVKAKGTYSPDIEIHLDQMSEASNNAAGLVRRLMQFRRSQDLHLRSLDVNDLVRDVVRLTQPLLRKNIGLMLDLDEDLPAVYGDPSRLEQVCLNLIVNAVEGMPDGGNLTIATHVAQGNQTDSVEKESIRHAIEEVVQISIKDTGIGIPVENQSEIFEPFFTTKSEGTGLGLSSAFSIIRQHGGKIGVQSLPGKGTAFTVSLPRMNTAAGSLSEDFAKAS
jgi:PAS domain S-box-containing protein